MYGNNINNIQKEVHTFPVPKQDDAETESATTDESESASLKLDINEVHVGGARQRSRRARGSRRRSARGSRHRRARGSRHRRARGSRRKKCRSARGSRRRRARGSRIEDVK